MGHDLARLLGVRILYCIDEHRVFRVVTVTLTEVAEGGPLGRWFGFLAFSATVFECLLQALGDFFEKPGGVPTLNDVGNLGLIQVTECLELAQVIDFYDQVP